MRPPALAVREIGSFHVGGGLVTLAGLPMRARVSSTGGPLEPIDPNGEIVAGQLYCQFVRLAEPRGAWPLLFWHGGGMTGVTWETTPDGRPGWQMHFLRAGFDTYVSDAMERGRASFAPWPEVYAEAPYFRTAREAWEIVFRFGPDGSWSPDPARRRTHPGLRFPVARFETFMNQFAPRWATNDAMTQRAYDALVERMGDCILLAHSQGCAFALQAALRAAPRVKAVILLDASGAPDPALHDAAGLRDVPHLFLYGDFLDRHPFWVRSLPAVRRWHEALRAAGAACDWIELPARGIAGNSHAMMCDDNSEEVAGIVLGWMRSRGLLA